MPNPLNKTKNNTLKLFPTTQLSQEILQGIILLMWQQKSGLCPTSSCHHNSTMLNDNTEAVCQGVVTQKFWKDGILQELGKM